MPRILITGATGNVGRETIKQLLGNNHTILAAVPPAEILEAKSSLPEEIQVIPFDFENPALWDVAFMGVDNLFLLRPPAIADVKNNINLAVDRALALGVKHIVFLSLLGVEKNPIVPHYKVEKHILQTQASYTFLRPSFFMQNLCGFFKDFILREDIVFCPAGKGKTSFIDVRDIAAVAALALMNPQDHKDKAYALTGNEALDYFQVAELLSENLQRKITYANPNPWAFRRRLVKGGFDPAYVNVLTGIFLTARFGLAKGVTPDTQLLLGREPIKLSQFIHDYSPLWQE